MLLSRLSVAESSPISLKGVTENIGRGGVAVLGDKLLPINSVLRCELASGTDKIGVPTFVEVRWCNQAPGKRVSRLGLQFLL